MNIHIGKEWLILLGGFAGMGALCALSVIIGGIIALLRQLRNKR